MSEVKKRLETLREAMEKEGADWYLITSDDYHTSEYVADFFSVREYYTGFTGDNACLVLNKNEAHMWTDGRFFIQAEGELKGSGIELMRMGEENVPTVADFIGENVQSGQSIWFDGRTVSTQLGKKIQKKLDDKGAVIVSDKDLAGDLWENRPALPSGKIWSLTDEEAGETATMKIERVRSAIKEKGATSLFLAKLDDIMWLTNLRGDDVAFNPVALSYMYISESKAYLFLQESETSPFVVDYAKKNNIELMNYEDVISFLEKLDLGERVLVEEAAINYACYKAISKNAETINERNVTTVFKAVKNEVELKNIREITIKDSAVVTKFMYWLKKNIGKTPISELSAAEKLDKMREDIEGFVELSFPTISGYGPNAAMMHYAATPESFSDCKAEGMLLVDSGGTYKKGTTDVTRTFILGPVSDETKLHFSKVAAGMLALADTTFLYGCTGRNLDIIARQPLWDIEVDYKCGTGHGVGYVLNVHEGPHGIRWAYNPDVKEAVLEDGMIMSDEPGVYIEGAYGIRTENVIECVKRNKNSDGQWMGFEHLTFVPIDRDGLDVNCLERKDIERINRYHAAVYEKIKDFMNEEELIWLKEVTKTL